MENLGDWLYFIIIAVIGVSSMFSSRKKKKQQEEQMQGPHIPREIVTPQSATDRDFWESLNETDEKRSPVVQPRKKAPARQAAKPSQPSPFLTNESEIEKAIRKQGAAGIFQEEEESTPLVTQEDFHDPDSLRKAIIYTEILNRKY